MKKIIVTGTEMLTYLNNEEVSKITDDCFFIMITSNNCTLFYKCFEFEDPKKFVCAVMKNADFTEGKGPMLLNKIFSSFDKAVEYILKQKGIYGSEQRVSNYSGVSIYGKPYCISGFNGYEIQITTVE